ncbi:Regulator of RpoS [Arenibacter antarcticus]|uniref:Response regulator n=1 Tax=Arenibacter antarcticus TaxID=2040469 RepID=A0ABW5VGE2_9FLAO|nr:response regulator [Arenibacter sp. H213]MCM4167145.1 transcriptional regulator [Arenibacter sp. H213]
MKRILLIEDDNALRENTEELLTLADYSVITACNGRIGIAKAKEQLPDIVVCDIMMPEIDGYGVLQELSSDENTKQIPFIFLSAKTEIKEIRKGMAMGADDYLTKPFEEEDLISAIESRLAKVSLLQRSSEVGVLAKDENKPEIQTLPQLRAYFLENGISGTSLPGEIIYEEGDRSNFIYLIVDGVVKCHSMDQDGKELITSLYRSDDFLGITSFSENVSYLESATAMETVKMISISKKDLKAILENNMDMSLQFVELLTGNITEIKAQLLQMAYSSVRKKTAQTLLQFAEIMDKNTGDPIKISRNDLASVAGIATESLIRTLSGFKKEGLIAIEGRNIRIKELKALQFIN